MTSSIKLKKILTLSLSNFIYVQITPGIDIKSDTLSDLDQMCLQMYPGYIVQAIYCMIVLKLDTGINSVKYLMINVKISYEQTKTCCVYGEMSYTSR